MANKERRLAIGVYPHVTLAEARVARDAARKLIKAGCDPVAMKREARRQTQREAANTFEVIAREWVEHQRLRWTPDHAIRVLQSLKNEVFPALGAKPISAITAPDLLASIRAVERRNALETASRVLQRCSAVFRYAIATGRATYNPAGDLRGALKTRKVTHHPALMAKDLPEFLHKLDTYEGDSQTKNALKLLVLTFVRTGELRAAEWSEFDLEDATWRIPAERMKMRAPHIVPLSDQAMELLHTQQALTGKYKLVFPSRSNVAKPMSENTLLYALYRMGYHSRATGHGFRATASTILNDLGWRPDVIERQLAHAERNAVRAAYHRSEYLQERRKMMQIWADYLDGLKRGADVVPLRSRNA